MATGFLGVELTKNEDGSFYHMFVYRNLRQPGNLASTTFAIIPAVEGLLPKGRKAMVNYRVYDLKTIIEQLRIKGIHTENMECYDYGRFTWIENPEGNKIELFGNRFDYSEYAE